MVPRAEARYTGAVTQKRAAALFGFATLIALIAFVAVGLPGASERPSAPSAAPSPVAAPAPPPPRPDPPVAPPPVPEPASRPRPAPAPSALSRDQWAEFSRTAMRALGDVRATCVEPLGPDLPPAEIVVDIHLAEGVVALIRARPLEPVPDDLVRCIEDELWAATWPEEVLEGDLKLQRVLEVP